MLRCKPTTANLGRPGSLPCFRTATPSTTTAVSMINDTTPVARLVYQSAVLDVMPPAPAQRDRLRWTARRVIRVTGHVLHPHPPSTVRHRPGGGDVAAQRDQHAAA